MCLDKMYTLSVWTASLDTKEPLMQEECVTIAEAARRIGMSDKTLRRAIHDGKLTACYPHPNKAEVCMTDVLSWRATLHVRPGETQERLQSLRNSDKPADGPCSVTGRPIRRPADCWTQEESTAST